MDLEKKNFILYIGLPLVTENKIVAIIRYHLRPFIFGIAPNECVENVCSLHLTEFNTTARVNPLAYYLICLHGQHRVG